MLVHNVRSSNLLGANLIVKMESDFFAYDFLVDYKIWLISGFRQSICIEGNSKVSLCVIALSLVCLGIIILILWVFKALHDAFSFSTLDEKKNYCRKIRLYRINELDRYCS